MKRTTAKAGALLLVLVWALPAGAASVGRIHAVGEDGKSYYEVTCSDGTRLSVVAEDAPRNVCIYANHLGRSCRTDWSVENAAVYACRTAPPRGPAP
jgi:hypothetical protein